jgi:hypothetical protein
MKRRRRTEPNNGQIPRSSLRRRFSTASFGLFATPFSQSSTMCTTIIWVTLGLFTSTERCAAGPGAQSCSRILLFRSPRRPRNGRRMAYSRVSRTGATSSPLDEWLKHQSWHDDECTEYSNFFEFLYPKRPRQKYVLLGSEIASLATQRWYRNTTVTGVTFSPAIIKLKGCPPAFIRARSF